MPCKTFAAMTGKSVETTKFATHRHGTAISTLRPRAFIGNSSESTSQVSGENEALMEKDEDPRPGRNGRAPAVGFRQWQGNITPFRAGAAAALIWPVISIGRRLMPPTRSVPGAGPDHNGLEVFPGAPFRSGCPG